MGKFLLPVEMQDALKEVVQKHDLQIHREAYTKGDFDRSSSTKDLNKRYRWDLMGYATRNNGMADFMSQAYEAGCNDDHIDNFLKSIVPPLPEDNYLTRQGTL